MKRRNVLFAGILTTMSVLAVCAMLAPAPAEAATCALFDGKWKCGGETLKAAKDACNTTTGNNKHQCDAGINVCTCATSSTKGPTTDLKTSGAGGGTKAPFSPKP